MQNSFGVIMLALVDKINPRVLDLKTVLSQYVMQSKGSRISQNEI